MSAENATDEKHDQIEHGGSEEQEGRRNDEQTANGMTKLSSSTEKGQDR